MIKVSSLFSQVLSLVNRNMSKADREWQAVLDSYDPGKVGLPDSD